MTAALSPDAQSGSGSGDVASRRPVDPARWTFVVLAAVLLPLMILSSLDFGVTWDEVFRQRNGELIWEFLRGQRSRASFVETRGHLYPGMFDTLCVALEPWVSVNRYVLRHAVNAVFGWVGIVYSGRLAARLFGRWCGVLAMVLLALTPRYFAHSMNNPKDLPFAAMSVVALYYISGVSTRWPYLTRATAAKIAISLALALGVRVGALLYLGYFGAFVAAVAVVDRDRNWHRLFAAAGSVLAIATAMLLLGTLFWPWAGGAPLTRPFTALLGAANYPWDGQVLFTGHEYWSDDLPWYYVPWWFLISTPLVMLVGAVLSCMSCASGQDALRKLVLWALFVLPVAATIGMGSQLYDGIRHLAFTVPVLAILAASGWAGMLSRARPRSLRLAAGSCLAVGLASVLGFHVRFHPNQVVYFNELIGGPRRAFTYYDMDYWGNCILQAVEWADATARSSRTVIVVSGNPAHVVQLDAERFARLMFSEPGENRHHLYVQLLRGQVAHLRNLALEPALHQVRTPDGAVLCTVTAGPAFGELAGVWRRAPSSDIQPNPQ